jgi:hypothetical protein
MRYEGKAMRAAYKNRGLIQLLRLHISIYVKVISKLSEDTHAEQIAELEHTLADAKATIATMECCFQFDPVPPESLVEGITNSELIRIYHDATAEVSSSNVEPFTSSMYSPPLTHNFLPLSNCTYTQTVMLEALDTLLPSVEDLGTREQVFDILRSAVTGLAFPHFNVRCGIALCGCVEVAYDAVQAASAAAGALPASIEAATRGAVVAWLSTHTDLLLLCGYGLSSVVNLNQAGLLLEGEANGGEYIGFV